MKIIPKGYVREKNNNPVSFDEQGNLTDQITGEKGMLVLPNFNVYGSKKVADMVAQRSKSKNKSQKLIQCLSSRKFFRIF